MGWVGSLQSCGCVFPQQRGRARLSEGLGGLASLEAAVALPLQGLAPGSLLARTRLFSVTGSRTVPKFLSWKQAEGCFLDLP